MISTPNASIDKPSIMHLHSTFFLMSHFSWYSVYLYLRITSISWYIICLYLHLINISAWNTLFSINCVAYNYLFRTSRGYILAPLLDRVKHYRKHMVCRVGQIHGRDAFEHGRHDKEHDGREHAVCTGPPNTAEALPCVRCACMLD
jgi:hypothetical protein